MTEEKNLVKVDDKSSWETALENENWVAPVVNIYETEDDFLMNAFMPGVKRDKVKIKLEDGSLAIMGRIDYEGALNRKYVLREMEIGNFYRKFKISDSIDVEKINASFEEGQLLIKLPKHERVKLRNIEIK